MEPAKGRLDIAIKYMKKNIKNILGLSILESLVATAIVGIGFIAILSMVNYAVQSIDTSGERTKANYLVSMMAEDVIGHRNSLYGVSAESAGITFEADGSIKVTDEDGNTSDVNKFIDHLHQTPWVAGGDGNAGPCGGTGGGNETNIYEGQRADAPRNKEAKWREIFDSNRYLKCRGENDIKRMRVYKICRWGDVCDLTNENVYDDGLYIGRIQINLNNGKKRKFLYFQADYKIRK